MPQRQGPFHEVQVANLVDLARSARMAQMISTWERFSADKQTQLWREAETFSPRLTDRQRAERYLTLSQLRAHFLRQEKGRAQARQNLPGRSPLRTIFAIADRTIHHREQQ